MLSYIQTYGSVFWYDDLKKNKIEIEDVAQSLSHQCRYNGHCGVFYSVAEHSVLVHDIVMDYVHGQYDALKVCRIRLATLLHDASEAYMSDLPSPLKQMQEMQPYRIIEEKIHRLVMTQFGVLDDYDDPSIKDAIDQADKAMLALESRSLHIKPMSWHYHYPAPTVQLGLWASQRAKHEFLHRYHRCVEGAELDLA